MREISIFLIGLGLLLTALGCAAFALIDPKAPELLGLPRNLVFAMPLLVVGMTHTACGILLPITKSNIWAYVGAVSNGVLSLMYFSLMGYVAMLKGGSLRPNLLMILFAAMPILLAARAAALAKAK